METKVLPAILSAEKILEIIVELEPDDITEALNAISKMDATYGTLWGAGNPQTSRLDLEFYLLKGEVLRFASEIQQNKIFPLVAAVLLKKKAECSK